MGLKDHLFKFILKLAEPEISIESITHEDFRESNYIEELYDGYALRINLNKLYEKADQVKALYDLKSNSAPKCSYANCHKKNPPPRIFCNGRYYHLDCFLKEDIVKSEMADEVEHFEIPVGIVVMKDNHRFPILWNYFSDTLDEYETAKNKDRLAEFYDLSGSPVYVEVDQILALKQPKAKIDIWTIPQNKNIRCVV